MPLELCNFLNLRHSSPWTDSIRRNYCSLVGIPSIACGSDHHYLLRFNSDNNNNDSLHNLHARWPSRALDFWRAGKKSQKFHLRVPHLRLLRSWNHKALSRLKQVSEGLWPPLNLAEYLYWLQQLQIFLLSDHFLLGAQLFPNNLDNHNHDQHQRVRV